MGMAINLSFSPKKFPPLLSLLIPLLALTLLLLYSTSNHLPRSQPKPHRCDLTAGKWVHRPHPQPPPLYDSTCPFHRNAWNCLRNNRSNMGPINSWAWAPRSCGGGGGPLPRIDPPAFLESVRGKKIGFVGDSLNENFLVAFLCALRSADPGAVKWKRRKAWRGGRFPKYDVTVGYHRAVLLAKYSEWGHDKFPEDNPLVFFREGKPIVPPLRILEGLQVVLESMVSHIEKEVPKKTLKFWRTQSPRHFYGGEWDHNGSCLFTEPLKQQELDSWFDPRSRGVNKEAREVNLLIQQALQGSDIQLLNLTHLSEFRADAHPAIWLGKKDAVAIWGQDCMHWCLPGVPDTWVDILSAQILYNLEAG